MDSVPEKKGTLGILRMARVLFCNFKKFICQILKRDRLSNIIKCILLVVMIVIAAAMVYAGLKDSGRFLQYSLTKEWFHMDINYKEPEGIGAVSFCFSIVALSNTILSFLNSERGRYGVNQFELLSLSVSKSVMILLQAESILCALLVFFAYIFHWYHIEYVGIIGCVLSVFLLVFLWIFTASEHFTKQCIYSIVWKDCIGKRKNRKQIVASKDLYRQKEIKDIFGTRIYRLMNQARLMDRYTLAMIMEGSFRAIGEIADCKYKKRDRREYYYRKIYSMVFIFLDTFHKNAGCNSIYRENLNEIIQDVPESNQHFWGSVRFGIVSAVFYAICRYMDTYQQSLENDVKILSEFWEYGKEFFKDCVMQNREYRIADVYVFLEMYSQGDKIPDSIIELLIKYKVDYRRIGKKIKDSKQLYQYCFSELNKMGSIKSDDTEVFLQTLIDDMDGYISKFDYYCKSDIMRKIQIWR